MANRKLQGEIDRVLKKVEDGVQTFENIWDKVYAASSNSQKEKYEADLKKEIKKLQRLRDHIKTWQGDSSIKDKSKLDANRKLIEEKMERFKVCEKETKTKAFSKEGLAQDRTDPKQKAKSNVGSWITEAISKLTEQCEEMEAEIETLNSGKRKKRKDNEEHPRIVQIKEHIQRHQYHMEMLERVLRAVYNENVSPAEVDELKENVDYYIESNQEPDFYEDMEMYDTLNLETAPSTTATAASSNGTSIKKATKNGVDDEDTQNITTNTITHSGGLSTSTKKGPASPRLVKPGRERQGAARDGTKLIKNASPKTSRRGNNVNLPSNNHGSTVATAPLTPNATTITLLNPSLSGNEHMRVSQISPKKFGTITNSSEMGKDSSLSTATSLNYTNSINSESITAPEINPVRTGGGNTTLVSSTSGKTSGRTMALNGPSNTLPGATATKILTNGPTTSSNMTTTLTVNENDNTIDSSSKNVVGIMNGVIGGNNNTNSNVQNLRPGNTGMFPPISRNNTSNLKGIPGSTTVAAATSVTNAVNSSTGISTSLPILSPNKSNTLNNESDSLVASGEKDLSSSSISAKGILSKVKLGVQSGLDTDDNLKTLSATTGSSKLDVDLSILEGVLQYMPEARIDTTKSPTSITSTSHQQLQKDKSTTSNEQQNISLSSPTITMDGGNMTPSLLNQQRRQQQDGLINTSSSPRNPMEVPSSFPPGAAPVFDSREVFQQFDPDTLFFIFYYQQGTYQQYLAASELKRQGWRFHKKYLTWFQRHDEPKISTDEYETGTFIYFDYANVVMDGQGSGWCQRIKSEFRFEYRFLEDEL